MERQMNYLQALRDALVTEMRLDPRVVVLGEDVRQSLRGITKGCFEEFGPERVWDTPISESAFVGLATGAALAGLRPVVELQIGTLLYVAMEQMANQAQKLRYMMGGQGRIPVTYLLPGSGARPGLAGQHSDHAYPMVVFAPSACLFAKGPVEEGEYVVPLGKGDIKRAGTDLTVVAVGPLVAQALKVAEAVEKDGISVEVLDPRTLLPLDRDLIEASVRKTGRLVIFDDSNRMCGFAAELAAFAGESLFAALKSPVVRVARADVPVPFSIALDQQVLARPDQLEAVIRGILGDSAAVRN
jgi:pyruvate/2-oxoglutarate/acetoin dehydrogenase E1 component